MSYTRIEIIEPCYAEFGQWMSDQRKKLGLIQGDIAPLLGVSRTSITNIECGNQRILYHQYLLLKEALASKEAWKKANADLERNKEDMILAKAEQIKRQRGLP